MKPILLVAWLLLLVGPTSATAAPAPPTLATQAVCGADAATPAPVTKVLTIVFENTDFDSVIGSGLAPNLNTLAQSCGLATNYHNVSHPSLPNYIAATSGGTQSISDDCQPSECSTRATSSFTEAIPSPGRDRCPTGSPLATGSLPSRSM